jgi:hypothetical protein
LSMEGFATVPYKRHEWWWSSSSSTCIHSYFVSAPIRKTKSSRAHSIIWYKYSQVLVGTHCRTTTMSFFARRFWWISIKMCRFYTAVLISRSVFQNDVQRSSTLMQRSITYCTKSI